MTAILFVLRNGCRWNALNATGICSSSTAHRRFVEWMSEGVFERVWRAGMCACEELQGIDWSWLPIHDATSDATWCAGKKRAPTRRIAASHVVSDTES